MSPKMPTFENHCCNENKIQTIPICMLLLPVVGTILSLALDRQSFVSRLLFLRLGFTAIFDSFSKGQNANDIKINDYSSLVLPLRFLPNAGCLACKVELSPGNTSFLAVVDTGSPFLTAPPATRSSFRTTRSFNGESSEQYGATVGRIEWRKASIRLGGTDRRRNLEVGIVPDNLIEETGGVFLGLMLDDDLRPSFLKQARYDTFVVDYVSKTLTLLSRGSRDDLRLPYPMYELSPFGENLHHYAIRCPRVSIAMANNRSFTAAASTKRDIVVVIDTGLTGCIVSESFEQEVLLAGSEAIEGMVLHLVSGTILQSQPKFWYCSTIRLPWFRDPAIHPHIIVAGATFLAGRRLSIDAASRKYHIE